MAAPEQLSNTQGQEMGDQTNHASESVPDGIITFDDIQKRDNVLNYLHSQGYYGLIVPEAFRGVIPDEKIASARCTAAENVIQGLMNQRDMADSSEAKRALSVAITTISRVRENNLVADLGHWQGDVDENLIRRQSYFRQPGEANGALDLALRLGLYEQITVRNFPIMRTLDEATILEMKIIAASNRVLRLQETQNSVDSRQAGLNNGKKTKVLSARISRHTKHLLAFQEQLAELENQLVD
jgi:hypothetical protein